MDKKSLQEIRAAITELDLRLVRSLEERAKLSKEVRGLLEGGAQPFDSDRDAVKLIDEQPEGDLPKDALRTLFAQISSTARSLERPVRVAFLGPEGGFCHQVTKSHFGAAATLIECATVQDAFEEVRRQRASFCTFPFDSSVEGLSVTAVSALAETDLFLVGERTIPAMHCLMNKSGSADDVQKVIGTSLAHATSEPFRKREFASAGVRDTRSPAEAARMAKEDPTSAALVPEVCGREHGLEVVKSNVGTEPELKTRFGIAGTRPASRSGSDTTCVLFSLDDAPGTLFQVLGHFAERGINLKKIQSRPVRGASWDYIFYVEVTGHVTDRAVTTALEAVKGSTKYLKLLGSYPTEPAS